MQDVFIKYTGIDPVSKKKIRRIYLIDAEQYYKENHEIFARELFVCPVSGKHVTLLQKFRRIEKAEDWLQADEIGVTEKELCSYAELAKSQGSEIAEKLKNMCKYEKIIRIYPE